MEQSRLDSLKAAADAVNDAVMKTPEPAQATIQPDDARSANAVRAESARRHAQQNAAIQQQLQGAMASMTSRGSLVALVIPALAVALLCWETLPLAWLVWVALAVEAAHPAVMQVALNRALAGQGQSWVHRAAWAGDAVLILTRIGVPAAWALAAAGVI